MNRLAVPGQLSSVGSRRLALFSSRKIPGDLVLKTLDAVAVLRDAGIELIGGFHSPVEKECLKMLLRGTQPIVVCPARSIKGYRHPAEWKGPIARGQLTMMSEFPDYVKRVTAESSEQRNRYVVRRADAVFIPYAAPASKTEVLAKEIAATGKSICTIIHELNANLLALGAHPVEEFLRGSNCL